MHEHMSSHSLFRAHALATHAQLSAALSELARAHGATRRSEAFQLLKAALLDHLRDEEELILPDFSLFFPIEAARIRGDHERLRQLLDRANGTTSGAQLDEQALEDLTRRFCDCASFAERVLYPWAEQRLRPSKKSEHLQRARMHARGGKAQ